MIPLLLALLFAASPAAAQRPACGFGLGLAGLRATESGLRQAGAAPDLAAARDRSQAAEQKLIEATTRLAGCGCPLTVDILQDARRLVEEARLVETLAALRQRLDRAGFALELARARLDRQGCS
jgi:hypothetical protein